MPQRSANPPLIPVIYARVLSNAAARSPGDAKRVLRGTGIDESAGGTQSLGMTAAQYRHLLQNAVEVSGDRAIALRAGMGLPITTHGDLGIATVTAPTFMASLEVFSNFIRVRNPFSGIRLVDKGKHVEVVVDLDEALGEQRNLALDLLCAAYASGPMRQARDLLSGVTLKMDRPEPDNADLYVRLLELPVRWGQDCTAFVFRKRDVDNPLPGANPEEFARAVSRLTRLYSLIARPASFREAVLAVFTRQAGRICNITTVTEALHVSPRTLNRKLKSEGTSYQRILDGWLGRQALRYLDEGGLTVEATAALLGYGDTANFRRAFKRWFGIPPGRHRRKGRKGDRKGDGGNIF